jgi:D-alanyl-D-alanine carboxypeptidase (penicillin-binding protein 5/6)
MRYLQALICCFSLFAASPLAGAGQTPSPPSVEAGAFVLQDYHTGRVLAAGNPDARMEPASLTKMMTVYVVLHELQDGKVRLDDEVPVSEKAWRTEGSRMFVEVGTRVSLENLLKGIIIQSGNDASVAVAEFIAGDEAAFAQLMNHYAQRLGMTGTNFVNATGLPHPDEFTNARDMARLARALISEFPEQYSWHSIREFVFNGITQYNRNKLLWRDESIDGIKTGYTESAGYALVASGERDGMRLISVVLGSQSEGARAKQSQTLLNYGFRFFETHRLYGSYEPVTQVRVWKGEIENLDLGLGDELYVTVPRGQYEKLKATMEVDSEIIAPVVKGDTKGLVKITLGEELTTERPLVALDSVDTGSLWKQLLDQVRLYFN